MKALVFYVLGALAVLSVVAVTAQATTLTFYGQGPNNAPVPVTYGSDVSVDTLEYVTTDGTGITPNIALAWPAHEGSPAGSVFEFHSGAGFAAANEEPILQLQMESRSAAAEIMFTPDPGYAVEIISFDVGSANNSGPSDPYTWTVTVSAASAPETPLLTKVTQPHGKTALTVETVELNFVGAPGTAYILKLDDGGVESYNGCIDNVRFSQVPEPTTIALLLAGLLGLVGLRSGKVAPLERTRR